MTAKFQMDILDKPGEECGVCAIYNHQQAAELTSHCLYALQHRGQESAGVVVWNGNSFSFHRGIGLVSDVFSDPSLFDTLQGSIAIGHNRYSTTGASNQLNIQPLIVTMRSMRVAVAHNGNLSNSKILHDRLSALGAIFQSSTDSEIILHLMSRSIFSDSIPELLIDALKKVEGAYSLIMLHEDTLIAARDPWGFRPLCLGKFNDSWCVASESCALDLIGFEYVREVEPGEIIIFKKNKLTSLKPFPTLPAAHCIFEYIYFSRPDSLIFGHSVDKIRRRFGKYLAEQKPVDADIVISVPDSSNTTAIGYASTSGIKYEIGLIRNHYVGRTFIAPQQKIRDFNVKIKFNTVKGVLSGRKVVVIDDSIVRGTTLKKLARLIREAGAKEIHVRIASPPVSHPCFFGMDFPTEQELIANRLPEIEDIRKFLEVDSLDYLSVENMMRAVYDVESSFCKACFDEQYPLDVNKKQSKLGFELSNSDQP